MSNRQLSRSLICASFCDVNTPNMANFKPPMWCQWKQSWEEMSTIGSCDTVQTRALHPVPIFLNEILESKSPPQSFFRATQTKSTQKPWIIFYIANFGDLFIREINTLQAEWNEVGHLISFSETHTHNIPQHHKTTSHNNCLETFKIQSPFNFLNITQLRMAFGENRLQICCSYWDQEKLPRKHQISSNYNCYYCHKSEGIFKRAKVFSSELWSQSNPFIIFVISDEKYRGALHVWRTVKTFTQLKSYYWNK